MTAFHHTPAQHYDLAKQVESADENTRTDFFNLRKPFDCGTPAGQISVCSAHPLVLEAACRDAQATGDPLLVEATCNQVNQFGGYTGQTPQSFREEVTAIASKSGMQLSKLHFGGDHLGPSPWTSLGASEAMTKASDLIAAYAAAGFTKLHLDTSMACADDPPLLPEQTIAARAADLAARAEEAAISAGMPPPNYVIGTEVPPPGGAREHIAHLDVSDPAGVARTLELHEDAFARRGLNPAFERVVALVVQPGLEFGNLNVFQFNPGLAGPLTAVLHSAPRIVYEAHSTDYQSEASLAALVRGGFSFLKVGPELTFALREALYGLDAIAQMMGHSAPTLPTVMERVMNESPAHWAHHYHGSEDTCRALRHFSYSDRIRYYWSMPAASHAVQALFSFLHGRTVPGPLLRQYLPEHFDPDDNTMFDPRDLVMSHISQVLRRYRRACKPS